MKITQITGAKGYLYLDAPQKSPEWVLARLGKIKASRLSDWLAVGKRDGRPLKARIDMERELAYEKQFGASFEIFVTRAIQDGIDYEDFVADQYSVVTGLVVEKCGAFYNDRFVASPDRLVGGDGLLEIKVMGDNSFSDVLENGVPSNYNLQIQGQLLSSGRKWCDFAAANLNTKRLKVIRIERDEELIKQIEDSFVGLDNITYKFDETGLYPFNDSIIVTEVSPELESWA